MEFRAIKRRLEDGRHFWGLFSSENDDFILPCAESARAAVESGSMVAASESDAGAVAVGAAGEQCVSGGLPPLGATVSKSKIWQKSGGHARVSSSLERIELFCAVCMGTYNNAKFRILLPYHSTFMFNYLHTSNVVSASKVLQAQADNVCGAHSSQAIYYFILLARRLLDQHNRVQSSARQQHGLTNSSVW